MQRYLFCLPLASRFERAVNRTRLVITVLIALTFALPAAQAQLYSTDFESYSIGSINGQDGWCVGPQPTVSQFPGFDNCQDSSDGRIVDEGTDTRVLEILAQPGFGFEVGRNFPGATKRYLTIEMDFRVLDEGGFWFMDNFAPEPREPDSLFWQSGFVYTNAEPGGTFYSHSLGAWHHTGVEIDQQGRRIRALNRNGEWRCVDDSAGTAAPATISRFLFRGTGSQTRLQVDNLTLSEADAAVDFLCSEVLFKDSFESQLMDPAQKAALVALYNSTNGDDWFDNTNWLVGDPCANHWFGVTCDGDSNAEEIRLRGNNLVGTLPSELGNLHSLKTLDLWANKLTGSIPPELGDLSNLEALDLVGNNLSAGIPPQLGNLAKLQSLDLSGNPFGGNIPAELGSLSNLTFLRLDANDLTGSIPPELGNLTALQYLSVYANNLSGSIPPELGNLSNLRELWLSNRLLSGQIPPELGQLTQLEVLHLSTTDVSGPIPATLGNLTSLRVLALDDNELTGFIPPELGQLSKLESLWLRGNPLQGEIPAELGNLSSLRVLFLHSNNLTGSIPAELGYLTNLEALELWDNHLTGGIPVELGNLTNLEILRLGDNPLQGEIPEELGALSSLLSLQLWDNQLTGPIPMEIFELTSLSMLFLGGNQLSGTIPPEFGNLTELTHLDLGENQLSGALPVELGTLTYLEWLRLDSNRLTGGLPDTLSNLTSLSELDLDWNGLHTSNSTLDGFLDTRQGSDWSATQTVPPANLAVDDVSASSVTLSWNVIEFTSGSGRYRVWCSLDAGGPYADCGHTPDKSTSGITVNSLSPSTTYYFVIRTETDNHADNQNAVVSGPGEVVSATTLEALSCPCFTYDEALEAATHDKFMLGADLQQLWAGDVYEERFFFLNTFTLPDSLGSPQLHLWARAEEWGGPPAESLGCSYIKVGYGGDDDTRSWTGVPSDTSDRDKYQACLANLEDAEEVSGVTLESEWACIQNRIYLYEPETDGLDVTINGVLVNDPPAQCVSRWNTDDFVTVEWYWGDGSMDTFHQQSGFVVPFPNSHQYSEGGQYTVWVWGYGSDGQAIGIAQTWLNLPN